MNVGIGQRCVSRWSEQERLRALDNCEILNTAREQSFDDLAHLAATLCHATLRL
jgi:hypothetical protein